jgi:hypothetical protein
MTLLFFFGTPALLALVGLALGWYVEYREPPPRHPGATAMRLRRSIAMLRPGALAMTREDASHLLRELGDVQRRLDRLRDGLRALLEEDD